MLQKAIENTVLRNTIQEKNADNLLVTLSLGTIINKIQDATLQEIFLKTAEEAAKKTGWEAQEPRPDLSEGMRLVIGLQKNCTMFGEPCTASVYLDAYHKGELLIYFYAYFNGETKYKEELQNIFAMKKVTGKPHGLLWQGIPPSFEKFNWNNPEHLTNLAVSALGWPQGTLPVTNTFTGLADTLVECCTQFSAVIEECANKTPLE